MTDKGHKVDFEEKAKTKAELEVDKPTKWCFYPKDWPVEEEIVMCRVLSADESGAKVALLEYKMQEGLLLFTEVTRNRMKSYRQFFNIGDDLPLMVVRMDRSKKYIDLSKKSLKDDNQTVNEVKERYEQAKLVQRLMLLTAAHCEISPEKVLQDISYRLYKDYSFAYEGLKAVFNDHSILKKYTADLPDAAHDFLLEQIIAKLTPPMKKCVLEFDATCMKGVDILREVLLSGTQMGEKDMPISVEVKGAPQYIMSVEAPEGEKGATLLREAAMKMKEELKKHRGDLIVRGSVKIF